ncbi:MAG: hypothetical protein ABJB66_04530 [Gemmatimonadaceae bacterium]
MGREFLDEANNAELELDARRTPIRISIRRPDDLLVGEVTLYNFHVTGSPPDLSREKDNETATLVLQLPPQSFGEQTYLDATGPEVKVDNNSNDNSPSDDQEFRDKEQQGKDDSGSAGPLKNIASPGDPQPKLGETRIRISGPSRMAFVMPANVNRIPFTIEGILNACRNWPQARVRSAAGTTSSSQSNSRSSSSSSSAAETFTSFVKSSEFITGQRSYIVALNELAPGVEVAVTAAGKRVADKIMASYAKVGTSGMAAMQTAIQSEVATLSAKFGALKATNGSALLTMAIVYQAAIDLSTLQFADTPGFQAQEQIPPLMVLGAPFRPGLRVTALEIPYRLVISPIAAAQFAHKSTAIAQQGRNELWHTRIMGDSNAYERDSASEFRAIWSEDYAIDVANVLTKPFRMPLDPQDRKMLVQLTTGYDEHTRENKQYNPKPVSAKRIVLSSLGGLLDADANWNKRPDTVDVESWRHMMSMGRDHYVRVVYSGFLLPFGHAASLIKVTERKFETTGDNALSKRIAILRQRFFLVVREPTKIFDGSYHITGGHPFPFTSVELLTRVTPNLVAPDDPKCKAIENNNVYGLYDATFGVTNGLTPRQLFWPKLTATTLGDFKFDIAATDRAGNRITFAMPLLFMSEVANNGVLTWSGAQQNIMGNVVLSYNAEGPVRRQVLLNGTNVCYAPFDDTREGDPRIPTDWLQFKAGPVSSKSATRINTYPEVDQARVALRALQRILNNNSATAAVHYPDIYRDQGFSGTNTGEVFLELYPPNTSLDVKFGPSTQAARTDVVGAVAAPTMGIQGLSRLSGLVGDVAKVATNQFNAATFFGDARILGSIKLKEIVTGIVPVTGPNAPKFVSRDLPSSGSNPARNESRYDWTTHLTGPDSTNVLIPNADQSSGSLFNMLAVTTTAVDSPGSSTATATATIKNFNVNLFQFIILWFRELTFTTENGKKPRVNVDLHPQNAVRFGGPLEFVNELKKLLPGNGFSDPAALSVTPSGISAHYALTIPNVQVGIFALSGVSVGARFTLPFDVQPMEVGFNFGERENPFSLTVSLLGGGGFLSIGIGADGVREIEAALEAGAKVAIDLGVASGCVEIKAGIYFHWLAPSEGEDGQVELSGYVRLHGELDIMGIISMSLTFNLQLGYDKIGHRSSIFGEATLTVEIEVLVFSGEVTVRCRREFGGSYADPTFLQLMPGTSTWSDYCLAFGAE